MELKVIHLLLVLLICLSNYAKMIISGDEDLELERQLKTLNKPPVKTILTSEGDIIDCVDIYKQPAFDHPSLKNHKLQLKPSSFPVGLPKTSSKLKSIKLGSRREACPFGTVPIKRTLKEDLIRTKNLSELPPLTIGEDNVTPGGHAVGVITKAKGLPYYGASAYVSIYNLSLAPDQATSTNLWIQSGPQEEINTIIAGWKVSQQLNGDNRTRMFTYWTGDGFHETGCYNTLCPGFVMTNNETSPNDPIGPASTPGGAQYEIKFSIFQDHQTGNWWLMVADDNIVVGYWPKEIFSHLGHDGAEQVAWGGIANAGNDGISPPMGNGNMPINRDSSYWKICYFRQVRYIDNTHATISPNNDATVDVFDKSGCYGLRDDKDLGDKLLGYSFLFGGPGGKCDG